MKDDIIRNAEQVADAFGLTAEQAADALQRSGPIIHSLLTGIDNPEPTVRTAAEPWRDYGDEHQE